uniref:UV radiation resistance-associated gene protein n=1 Tax=Ananas comosus var. bracteatus TaxID=296719 RepID=A0A6V7NFR1_ANACO|nr:unnamed protein product [Ananas comosus var. bracteatus]
MDPDRSDALDLAAPGSMAGEEEEEASGWAIVAAEDVEGAEAPKVVEWEDLQQELARLWSLVAALGKAKERKETLARRLESIIEVRRKSLHQTNELEEMRQKLEARKVAMQNMLMHVKKEKENVEGQREKLLPKIKMLLVAGKTLSAAHQQLQEANKLLSGEKGLGHLKNLQKMLRMRERYMVAQVASLYPVKTLKDKAPVETLDSSSGGTKTRDDESSSPNMSRSMQLSHLAISGLQLTTLPMQKMSFFTDKKEVRRSATVLGYVAHAVLLIAKYLDVPLRYPLRLGGSRSYIQDHAPSVESTSAESAVNSITTSTNSRPTEFPLFLEGQDTTRAAYAMFLLNKDLEQLLNYVGAESLGPRHVLANLKELVKMILSQKYVDN